MKRHNQIIAALFLIPLYLLSLLNLVLPSQVVSASENRTLHQLPAFSWTELLNGQYTQKYEDFFSDQFPFRQFFVDAHQRLLEWMQAPLAADITIFEGPGDDIGQGERLEPDPADLISQAPEPLPTTQVTTGNPGETTSPTGTQPSETTAPTETTPTSNATTSPATEETTTSVDGPVTNYSAVIIVNDRAMEIYGFSESRNLRYAELVSRLQSKLPEVQVYDLVAPTSIEFYSPEKYHSLSGSQKNAIAYIYAHMAAPVITVDGYGEIAQHLDDYLYFRTDHHWTAIGAYYAYRAFARSAGFEPIALDSFVSGRIDGDFLGTLYRYTSSSILRSHPDYVDYYLPKTTCEGKAFTNSTMTEGYRVKLIYTKVGSTNKYLAFTGGDNPLIQYKTSLQNGKRILVIKESFGNALVPFLTNHYEEVYVLDPRLIDLDLPQFIKLHQIQEVLVVNYAFGASNTGWNNPFERMIG